MGWGRVHLGEQRVGNFYSIDQYLVRTGRGSQGSATRPASGQCWNRRTSKEYSERGDIHVAYLRIFCMDDRDVDQTFVSNHNCVVAGVGMSARGVEKYTPKVGSLLLRRGGDIVTWWGRLYRPTTSQQYDGWNKPWYEASCGQRYYSWET